MCAFLYAVCWKNECREESEQESKIERSESECKIREDWNAMDNLMMISMTRNLELNSWEWD